MQFLSVNVSMSLHYRNFVPLNCVTMCMTKSKVKIVYKMLFGLAYVKKKKKPKKHKTGVFGNWALSNTFAQMLKVNF